MEGIVPTLLVGLGGIGSMIVEKVYMKIPEERRKEKIAVHAFDTNINDIKQRKHLKGNITQTSTDITVGNYLERADESVSEWFPHEIQLLKRKTMTDGAGQIRCVSRLAYHAAIKDGKLDDLETKISKIFSASGDTSASSIRVMIVSSLAGGTGAGIFLQTALYLRELFEVNYNKSTVIVRGAFLLPDVLIHTKVLPENQWENVRANAYACFKELDAITKNADRQTMGNVTTSIEFEYKPGQTDQDGQQNYVISSNHLPYDYCFLFDYLSLKGEQINNFEHYIDQMANTTYLQLFSPLTDGIFSVEDNQILSLISGLGGNRYCGAGTSTLIYPYDDLVDYLSLRWAETILSNEWCKIDEDFDDEYRHFENDANLGVSRTEPELDKKYSELIKTYATGMNTHPFFYNIHRSTSTFDEDGQLIDHKSDLFIEAIETFVSNHLQSNDQLSQKKARCNLDHGKLNMKAHAEEQVEDMETNLSNYKKFLFKNIQDQTNYIVNQVIREDCNAPSGVSLDQDFSLNAWILKRPEPLHPVAVRYFLYQIKDILEQRILQLSNSNKNLKEAINQYKEKYQSYDNQIFSAEEYVRAAKDQSFFKRVIKDQFKAAVNYYASESQAQLNRLNQFSQGFLLENVFSEILKQISEMLVDWQHFFRNLNDVRFKLANEIQKCVNEHEATSDPTIRFVHASKRIKESLWDDIRPSLLQGNKLPPEICRNIYLSQYQLFCQRGRRKVLYADTIKEVNVESQFRETVLEWCRQKVKHHESINMNVITAMKRHALLIETDSFTKIKEELSAIDQLANPYIYTQSHKPDSLAYWGIHPSCLKVLTENERDELFGNTMERITDEAFSPYEIIRYRNAYGIFAENIPAFQASFGTNNRFQNFGTYFRAYKQRVEQLERQAEISITPHLDKRWHKSAYMPDINKEMVKADQQKTQRAYLLGLIHGRLTKIVRDNVELWECHTKNQGRKAITIGSKKVNKQFYDLFQSMSHNPAHVDMIIEHVNKIWEIERHEKIKDGKVDICRHSFVKGCFCCPYKEGTRKIKVTPANRGKKTGSSQKINQNQTPSLGKEKKTGSDQNTNQKQESPASKEKKTGSDQNKKQVNDQKQQNNVLTDQYNVFDVIFVFFNEYPNEDLLPLTMELLKCLLNEIKNYFIEQHGKGQLNKAKMLAKDLIKKLREGSIILNGIKKDNDYVYRRWNDIIDDFIKNNLKVE